MFSMLSFCEFIRQPYTEKWMVTCPQQRMGCYVSQLFSGIGTPLVDLVALTWHWTSPQYYNTPTWPCYFHTFCMRYEWDLVSLVWVGFSMDGGIQLHFRFWSKKELDHGVVKVTRLVNDWKSSCSAFIPSQDIIVDFLSFWWKIGPRRRRCEIWRAKWKNSKLSMS